MTALWFLLVAGFALGAVAVLWRVAAVVLEVLREPLPASLRGPSRQAPVPAEVRARPGVDHHARDVVAADAIALLARRGPATPTTRTGHTPSWGDLLAETLREVESVRA